LRAVGRGLPQRPLTASRNLCDAQEAVDTRQELDEDAEVGRADRAPAHDLPFAQSSRYCGPRIALEGLQAERDPALLLVDPEHLDGQGVTDAQEVSRTTHARMGQPRHRHEPLPATGMPVCAAMASACRAWAPWRSLCESRISSPVDTTVASTSSPTATRSLPSPSVSSARSIQASPLPPTSTNTLSAEIWMTRPFTTCPISSTGRADSRANRVAKSSASLMLPP